VDTRFHTFAGPTALGALLRAIGLALPDLDGDGPLIHGAEELGLAGEGHLALAAKSEYREALLVTAARAVIVSFELESDVPAGTIAVVAADPHAAFAAALDILYPGGVRGAVTALLEPEDDLHIAESDVQFGPGVVLGPGVEVGRGSVVGPNSVLGAGVTLGRNCVIGSNVSIECAHLGNNVVVHAGARIGIEGFGWLDHGRTNRKIPQLGRVIVQDRVEIGANTTIDRGALGDTVIGEGTKIDNLVQIGHNCRIGRNVLIAGTVGLAGSTIIGDGAMLGGGAGSAGHLTIGQGSVLAGRTVVTKDVPPGMTVAGYPADEVGAWRRQVVTLRRLSKGTKSGR
ncbi:MAG: UDP-3-O-(3-hydroxymyristoyl)glucosamine N-acyltransferase, partial [Devosia sp.]